MSSTYNIVGSSKDVNEIISRLNLSRRITDVFKNTVEEKDINISIEDDQVDDLIDVCNEYGINPLLV
jgi:hypothetical protein